MIAEWAGQFSVSWFDMKLAVEIFPFLAEATTITVFVTISAFALALAVGFPILLMRRLRVRTVSRSTTFLVEFVRSTPILVQIYFFFFILPDVGIRLSPVATGILTITLHYGCYMSEVDRSGLESIPHGQWDAVTALGFSPTQTYRYVILPQVIPPIVLAAGNFLVCMVKDSPLLAAIGTVELMFIAKDVGQEKFQYMEPITLCGLIFHFLSLGGSAGTRWVEARVGRIWMGKDRRRI